MCLPRSSTISLSLYSRDTSQFLWYDFQHNLLLTAIFWMNLFSWLPGFLPISGLCFVFPRCCSPKIDALALGTFIIIRASIISLMWMAPTYLSPDQLFLHRFGPSWFVGLTLTSNPEGLTMNWSSLPQTLFLHPLSVEATTGHPSVCSSQGTWHHPWFFLVPLPLQLFNKYCCLSLYNYLNVLLFPRPSLPPSSFACGLQYPNCSSLWGFLLPPIHSQPGS